MVKDALSANYNKTLWQVMPETKSPKGCLFAAHKFLLIIFVFNKIMTI